MTDLNHDKISITWHVDDVRQRRPSLTKEQARAVLLAVKNNHNSSIGVNWEEIDYWIEDCFPEFPANSSNHKERGQS